MSFLPTQFMRKKRGKVLTIKTAGMAGSHFGRLECTPERTGSDKIEALTGPTSIVGYTGGGAAQRLGDAGAAARSGQPPPP
jgi:hypothetical protein